jgi:hypothetical protein
MTILVVISSVCIHVLPLGCATGNDVFTITTYQMKDGAKLYCLENEMHSDNISTKLHTLKIRLPRSTIDLLERHLALIQIYCVYNLMDTKYFQIFIRRDILSLRFPSASVDLTDLLKSFEHDTSSQML